MKKILALTMVLLITASIFVFGIVSAQEQEIATAEDIKIAGITPDSPLYGIELAFEGIIELFSENVKLSHAAERLAETKVMISEDKLFYAQRAINNFELIFLRVENKSKIEEHKKLMDNLGQKVSEIASQKGALTEEDRTKIKGLIEEHRENVLNERKGMINNINKISNKNMNIGGY
ncbi:MAG: DUF5667 domain-containing protein [Nanoarchaeota archaeon]